MKLTVEVNLMDLFSDYEIDNWNDVEIESVGNTLKNELKTKVLSELSEKMLKNYTEKIKNDLAPIYEEILNDVSEEIKKVSKEFITKKVIITDPWGDVIQKDVSVLDLIKERMEETFDIENKRSPFRGKLDDMFAYELKRKGEIKVDTDAAERIKNKINQKLMFAIKSNVNPEQISVLKQAIEDAYLGRATSMEDFD